MARDFTQEQSLSRHCQKMCHLLQTCQLTSVQFGIENDQFPNCQRDVALIVALYFLVKGKQKSTIWLDILLAFSLRHKPAASQDTEVKCSANSRSKQ